MIAFSVPVAGAGEPAVTEVASATAQSTRSQQVSSGPAIRYDFDYPVIGYSKQPRDNPIARLQERVDRGEVSLEFQGQRGYLDSILRELGVSPSSQTLVYSKTSLQIFGIRAETPRAIYFNDNTYVAWVQGSDLLEFATMDTKLGAVFYGLANRNGPTAFERETSRCLTCHDKFGMSGGGVPLFTVLSSLVDTDGQSLTREVAIEVTHETPIEKRWGGWYVTGQHGKQTHLGNIQAQTPQELARLDRSKLANLDTLQGLFDTKPYITDKSDIVALMVLEHQTFVQNLITRINFKSRSFVARDLGERSNVSWEQIPPATRTLISKMIGTLVDALLLAGEAEMIDAQASGSGFDQWFEAQGPRDPQGRSLRELDLKTRMFKYPLSYLIYSEAFDGLPQYVREQVFIRLENVLSGRDQGATYAKLTSADRQAVLEILRATKPEFVRALERRG